MHSFAAVVLCVLASLAIVFAQTFSATTIQGLSTGSFRNGSAGYIRAYKVVNIDNHILFAEGFRAVGGIANHTGGLAADLILFAMSTEFDAAVGAAYFDVEARAGWSSNGNVTAAQWSAAGIAGAVRFFKIIEYDETNGVSGFQPGADTVVGHYHLLDGPWRWNNFTFEQFPAANDPTITVHRVTAATKDGVFAFRVSVSGNYTSTGRYKLDPSTLKLDVLINYYSSSNTKTYYSSGPSDPVAHPNATLCLVAGLAGAAGSTGGGAWTNVPTPTDPDNADLSAVRTVGAKAGNWGVFFTHDTYANWTTSGVGAGWQGAGIVAVESDTDPTASTGLDAGAQVTSGAYAGWKAMGGKLLQFFSYTGAYRPATIEWDPAMQLTGVNQGTATNVPTTVPTNPSPPTGSASTAILSVFALFFALFLLF